MDTGSAALSVDPLGPPSSAPPPRAARPVRRVIAPFLLALPLLAGLPSPALGGEGLWVAGPGEVQRLVAADGNVAAQVAGSRGALGLAYDPGRGRLWVYAPPALLVYDDQGQALLQVPVSAPVTGRGGSLALAVDPVTGQAWLGLGPRLTRVDLTGQVAGTVDLPEPVVGLAADLAGDRMWVATETAVTPFDAGGAPGAPLDLGPDPLVSAVAVDPGTGDLWVALAGAVRRHEADGSLAGTVALPDVERLGPDGTGGAWAATGTRLVRLDAAGQVVVDQAPFTGRQRITALGTDVLDQSVWVGAGAGLLHVGSGGQALLTLGSPRLVRGLVVRREPSAAPSINDPPTVGLIASPAAGRSPLQVGFTAAGSDPDGDLLAYSWQFGDGSGPSAGTASRQHTYPTVGTYTARVTVSDGQLGAETTAQVTVEPPPDPAEVAPGLVSTIPSAHAALTGFLYTGPGSIQSGVAPGTIQPQRAATVIGRVLDRDGAPLPGVTVRALGRPELGFTETRADGNYDLAVNGGIAIIVVFERPGLLPAHRQVVVPWQRFAPVPDVVLIPLDAEATVVDLTAPGLQVARGRTVTDADGSRRATLLVPAGTTASLVLPGGGTTPVTTLTIRQTEYTEGDRGPERMPAQLPPPTAYTYAVELSADEALAVGATTVQFSQPLPHYLDNFLGMPVGERVPVGYYDRGAGRWVGENDGRVVKVLGVTGGLADLDTDGDAAADDGPTLAALGITPAERQVLAGLYGPGQSLWRVALTHFTTYDYNWYGKLPNDATGPPAERPRGLGRTADGQATPKPDRCPICEGSAIEAANQVLDETIPLVGVAFALHYASDRVPGSRGASVIEVPVTGGTPSPSMLRAEIDVEVAGQLVHQVVPGPVPSNLTLTVPWDGRDRYGRPTFGAQPVTVTVSHMYRFDIVRSDPERAQNFGLLTAGVVMGIERSRAFTAISRTHRGTLTSPFSAPAVGGWSLGVHHAYDPGDGVLYLGDGRRRSETDRLGRMMETVYSGPALNVNALAGAPDGRLHFIRDKTFIDRLEPDGSATLIVGGGGDGGDGPALTRLLFEVRDLAFGPDGLLYFIDFYRIRRLDADGIVRTLAGAAPNQGSTGDGGPGLLATFAGLTQMSVAGDGRVFVMDAFTERRIRVLLPDGRVDTHAGGGATQCPGDVFFLICGVDGPARLAGILDSTNAEVGPDGSVYFFTLNSLYQVTPDGILRKVTAGLFENGVSVDGALAAQFNGRDVGAHNPAVGPDGSFVFFGQRGGPGKSWTLAPDGHVYHLAGNGQVCQAQTLGDGGPATAAQTCGPSAYAVDPQGRVYLADAHLIRLVRPAVPGFGGVADAILASEDGRELYRFDPSGRHLETRHALTGALLWSFGYDAAGRLVTLTDGDLNVTTVQRDGAGVPTAIVAPFGQVTALTVDANGYLATVANPAGNTVGLTHDAGGLLTGLQTPRGHDYAFHYDAAGRLDLDTDPAGGTQTFDRAALIPDATVREGQTVTRTTGLGRVSTFEVAVLQTTERRQTTTQQDGTVTSRLANKSGHTAETLPTGAVVSVGRVGDSRFGMQAPVTAAMTEAQPSTLTRTSGSTRTVTLDVPHDVLSLTQLTETFTVNAKTTTSVYDAATRQFTLTSPAGRIVTGTIDLQGRPVASQVTGLAGTTVVYDPQGRVASVTQGGDPETRTWTFTYTAESYLATVTDPLLHVTSFGYDAAGRRTSTTLPDTRVVGFGWDASGNLTSLTPPGRLPHAFQFSTLDQQTAFDPPAVGGLPVDATQFTYNTDRELTTVGRPDGLTLTATRDAAGRVGVLTFSRGTLGFTYGPGTGLLTGLTAPGSLGLGYAFDGDLLTGVTWTGAVTGSLGWTYDTDFRPATQTLNGGSGVSFAYDADSLLTGVGSLTLTRDAQRGGLVTATTLENLTDAWTYDTHAEPTAYGVEFNGGAIYTLALTRDALGRVTQKVETIEGVTDTYVYGYDPAGRLTSVTKNVGTAISYTYDTNGNRTTYTGPLGNVGSATLDGQDRMTAYGAATYTYNAAGDLASRTVAVSTTAYTYDELGNLTQVVLPGGTTIDYLVDGANRRIGKKVGGVLQRGWLWEGPLRIAAEIDGTGTGVVSRFVYGTRGNAPEYVVQGGETYRVVTDLLGSLRLVVKASDGTIVQRMNHDEFGRVTQDVVTGGFTRVPFGFAGGLYDPDTGLVRFGARDYDPETGRWTTRDPIGFQGGSANLYAYVTNDPVNLVDPTGLEPCPCPDATQEVTVPASTVRVVGVVIPPPFRRYGPPDRFGHRESIKFYPSWARVTIVKLASRALLGDVPNLGLREFHSVGQLFGHDRFIPGDELCVAKDTILYLALPDGTTKRYGQNTHIRIVAPEVR